MGNLSSTKKKQLKRKNAKRARDKIEVGAPNFIEPMDEPKMPSGIMTLAASFVEWVIHQRPDLMLCWGYPKKAREGIKCLELRNAAGDIMRVYAGPYMDKPRGIDGLKMAREIKRKCTVDIPTDDFSTPDAATFKLGIRHALDVLVNKGEIYVGCMGGIGRTGMALAGLMMLHARIYGNPEPTPLECRTFLRENIHPHAIETPQQLAFLEGYLK